MISPARRVVYTALLAAAGIALYVLEPPIPVPLPFMKIGLANVSTVLALYILGGREALTVTIVRVVAGSAIVGTLFSPSFILSMPAGVVSAAVMILTRRLTGRLFGPFGLSLLGAFSHVMTQYLAVHFLLLHGANVTFLVPLLSVTALGGGIVVGLVSAAAIAILQQSGDNVQIADSRR